eukprot:gene27763-36585_t
MLKRKALSRILTVLPMPGIIAAFTNEKNLLYQSRAVSARQLNPVLASLFLLYIPMWLMTSQMFFSMHLRRRDLRNLVSPDEFELVHDHSVPPAHTNEFKDYIASFEDRGVKFFQRNDKSKVCDLSGRPDFLITPSKSKSDVVTTKDDRLHWAICIIELQSKHPDEDIHLCEVQLQFYLMIYMNRYGLPTVVGFLVQDNGMCRTYKAIRQPQSIMYEQNDLVHVSHIAEVLRVLWEDASTSFPV